MFGVIGEILFWLLLVALVVDAIHGFVTSSGSVWQRLLAVGKSSATILVARISAIGGLATSALVEIANVIGSPGVSSALTTYVNSKAVGYVIAGAAFVIEFARRRTLSAPLLGKPLEQ